VRKSGTRLRITAQLINVEDGYHLWSDSYDRELTDIFAIQDEISAAIVAALQVHLTGKNATADTRPASVEAYNFLLLGRESVRQRTLQSLELALKQYQRALEIDPDYAAAWAGKALASFLLSTNNYGTTPVVEAHRQAQAMLDKALSLSPDLGLAHATQALIFQQNQEPFDALESINRAIGATPSEGILYSWKANALQDLGRYNESAEALETGFRIDPLHRVLRNNFRGRLILGGDYRRARELVVPGSAEAYRVEAFIAGKNGHYADAVGYLEKILQAAEDGGNNSDQLGLAYVYLMLLRNPEMALQSVSAPVAMLLQAYIDPVAGYPILINLPEQHQNNITRGFLNVVLLRTGRCDELLQLRADRGYPEKPLYGNPGDDFSPVSQATIFAWCLKQQGRDAEAHLLAQRITAYIEGAVANGQPPDYFNLLARAQMVLGEEDEALGSLKLAWQHYDLHWLYLEGPLFEPLHEHEEFKELQSEMLDHTNTERAKLGWEPATLLWEVGSE
jgi:tetratricopeptide (TPR) repeat protein